VAAEGVMAKEAIPFLGLSGLAALVRRRAPDVLYHYTTQEGVIGILSERAVRATRIAYLNDAREYTFALDATAKVLEARRASLSSKNERDAADGLLGLMSAWTQGTSFVFSLTAVEDDLSQWRGYGGTGTGYALGFRTAAIRQLEHVQGWRLFPCLYRESTQQRLITELVDRWFDHYRRAAKTAARHNDSPVINLLLDFFAPLSVLASLIKNPKFEAEREWRGVVPASRPESRKFRSGRSMIAPYVEVPLVGKEQPVATHIISKIVVGPTPHPELAVHSVTDMASVCGLHPLQVVASRIPYRNW